MHSVFQGHFLIPIFWETLAPPFCFLPWGQENLFPLGLRLPSPLRLPNSIMWQKSTPSISTGPTLFTWQDIVTHFDTKRDKLTNFSNVCVFFNETYSCISSIIYTTPIAFDCLSYFTCLGKMTLGYWTSHCIPSEYLILWWPIQLFRN